MHDFDVDDLVNIRERLLNSSCVVCCYVVVDSQQKSMRTNKLIVGLSLDNSLRFDASDVIKKIPKS